MAPTLANMVPIFRPFLLSLTAALLLSSAHAQSRAASGTDQDSSSAPKSPARPDLLGTVLATNGLPHATVFISTAGPKVGTSTFCPSCYADCRKSAKTDAQGNFKIESLDPQLRFQLLVVASGYIPKFVSKVDPAKGPVKVSLEVARAGAAPAENNVAGRVLGPDGQPIAGAVVEPHGVHDQDGGGRYGNLPGVDPLAVTDDEGQFVITSRNHHHSMDLKVRARALANQTFTELRCGTNRYDLRLSEGATVTGRVLLNGKPLANVGVGMVSADRGMEKFTGNFDVGTDAKGRFAFVNLPPNTDYFLYGSMETLRPYGAIANVKVRAGADGQTTDAGELTVSPAHRLAGRVVLSDGKPVPAKTRLLVGRENAWDTLQVELDKAGRFDTGGLPTETYSLSARVPGYHISPQNGSLELMNPFHIIGRVDQDITNLLFLLEPGPDLRPDYDSHLPETASPRHRPLRGAETAGDHSHEWTVSGRILDAETREPIAQARLTPGTKQDSFNPASWDIRHKIESTNGLYLVYLDKKFAEPQLKVEAEGYVPAAIPLRPQNRTNFDLTLRKGSGPSGTVLLPGGKPAAGITVVLLCDDSRQTALKSNGEWAGWRNKDREMLTDPDGRFSFDPELGMQAVAAATRDGFKIISVAALATGSNMVLESWGGIKGVLNRPAGPGKGEDLDLALVEEPRLNLNYHTVTDAQGRFEFDHVPPGKLQISSRTKLGSSSWQNDPLQQVTVQPGEALEVAIKAPEKQKADRFPEAAVAPKAPKPTRKPGPGPKGIVLLPDGRPAAEAEVALKVAGKYLSLGKAAFRASQAREEGLIVNAGADGRFTLPSEQDAESVIAVHPDGFAEVSLETLKALPQITLQPWGSIEGTLHIGRRLGTNEFVLVRSGDSFSGPSLLEYNDFRAQTDDQGRFSISYVPPGERELVRLIASGANSFTHGVPTPVTVKPSLVTEVSLGGTGRTVLGQALAGDLATNINWPRSRATIHTPYPKQPVELKMPQEQQKWYASEAGHAAWKKARAYSGIFSSDGSFRADEVLPGKYELDIMLTASAGELWKPEDFTATAHKEIVIPDPLTKDDDTAVDLGKVEVKPKTAEQTKDSHQK